MADLTFIEKQCLQELFEMNEGYVLDFTNNSFSDFFRTTLNVDIYDEKYEYLGDSKARRLNAFWEQENDYKVSVVLKEFLEYLKMRGADTNDPKFIKALNIVKRLTSNTHINVDDVLHIWKKDKIRIFISHRDKYKSEAKKLAQSLDSLGVTCFVAHDSIQPMSIWKNEIYKALETMDGFVCFITKDYYESVWTNQEIGYALAKGVPFFQYSYDGFDPQGFKSEIQAIKSGEIELRYFIKKAFFDNDLLKRGVLQTFLDAKDGTFASAKSKFQELLGFQFQDNEIDEIAETISGPAKYINQLACLLTDEAPALIGGKYPAGTPYRVILENEILNQHSQSKYVINQIGEYYKVCNRSTGLALETNI